MNYHHVMGFLECSARLLFKITKLALDEVGEFCARVNLPTKAVLQFQKERAHFLATTISDAGDVGHSQSQLEVPCLLYS